MEFISTLNVIFCNSLFERATNEITLIECSPKYNTGVSMSHEEHCG